jgi:hypothetical protein
MAIEAIRVRIFFLEGGHVFHHSLGKDVGCFVEVGFFASSTPGTLLTLAAAHRFIIRSLGFLLALLFILFLLCFLGLFLLFWSMDPAWVSLLATALTGLVPPVLYNIIGLAFTHSSKTCAFQDNSRLASVLLGEHIQ